MTTVHISSPRNTEAQYRPGDPDPPPAELGSYFSSVRNTNPECNLSELYKVNVSTPGTEIKIHA